MDLCQAVPEPPVVANMVGMFCPWWIAKPYAQFISFFGDGCCAFAEGS
jgi:hypothetical protein